MRAKLTGARTQRSRLFLHRWRLLLAEPVAVPPAIGNHSALRLDTIPGEGTHDPWFAMGKFSPTKLNGDCEIQQRKAGVAPLPPRRARGKLVNRPATNLAGRRKR